MRQAQPLASPYRHSVRGGARISAIARICVPRWHRSGRTCGGAHDPRDSVGRGATLALNRTMCHGAQGLSASDAPNLAGQYPAVVIKQLHDYKNGNRSSAIMEALAKNLSDR